MTYVKETIYSAVVIGDGAVGTAKLCCISRGSAIPFLGQGELKPHQLVYSELTTSIVPASEVDLKSVGHFMIKRIRVEAEQHASQSMLDKLKMQAYINGNTIIQDCTPLSVFSRFDLGMFFVIDRLDEMHTEIGVLTEPLRYDGAPFLVTVFFDGEREVR